VKAKSMTPRSMVTLSWMLVYEKFITKTFMEIPSILNVGVWEVDYEDIYGEPLEQKVGISEVDYSTLTAIPWSKSVGVFEINDAKVWTNGRYVPMFCKMSDYQRKMIELWFIMIWTNWGIEFCVFCTTCLFVCECIGVECIKVVNRNGEGQVRSSSRWTTAGEDQTWRLWPRDQEARDEASERHIWVLVIEWQH
jgi:hypothetical protein